MKLYHQELGNISLAAPLATPMVILHGLFGASDNWITVGRVLAEKRQVFLIDQRNHGKSPHSTDWDYNTMSNDLQEFLVEKNLTNVILLGHSMGGKTVMNFACNQPKTTKNKDTTGWQLSYSRKLPEEFILAFGVKQDSIEFTNLPLIRKDDILAYTVNLAKEWSKNFEMSLAWESRKLDSNIQKNDATNRSVVLGMTYTF